MRIHAHIRSNIASRHSEGDLGFRISISAATPESFQACECKSTTAIPMKKRKKVAVNFHSYVTI